ncbi:neurensin-2 [Ambystoma mexicanum]|uniref:neurensin-2 n=1 Tax=Ambystoma mexicanum TaxID=8296 RepID=UPI0037E84BD9
MDTCGCVRGPTVTAGKWYGVRSYLHLFYEDCAGALPDDDLGSAPHPHHHHGCQALLWKVSLSTGTLLLLIGMAALATGVLVPHRLEGIAEGQFVVVDQKAVEYNQALTICKVVGIVLCAAAGVLMASSLVSSIVCRPARRAQEEEEEEQLSPILREGPPKKCHS